MSTLLQSYEEEYRELIKTSQDELAALKETLMRDAVNYKAPPLSGSGSRLQRGTTLRSNLGQLKELMSNMEYEANELPAALRESAKERLEHYRRTIRTLEEEINKTRVEASAADRVDLLSSSKNASAATKSTTNKSSNANINNNGVTSNNNNINNNINNSNDELDDETRKHRLQMTENTDKFKQASHTLLKSERLLNETEDVGNNVLTSLRGQTETMHQINESTFAVEEEISATRKILSNMQRVMIKHKLILVCIILLLIFLIVVAIYAAVGRGRNRVYPSPTQIPVDPIPTSSMTATPN